ncbi:MAG: hypothetical protein SFU56_04135 [Capsulimonadales bacterium]|nr:hypothetical protein [Capsulimonadales bacterium]
MSAQSLTLPASKIQHLDRQALRQSPRYFREVAEAGESLYVKLADAKRITEKETGKEIAIDLRTGSFGIGTTSTEALAQLGSSAQTGHIYFRTITLSREKSPA